MALELEMDRSQMHDGVVWLVGGSARLLWETSAEKKRSKHDRRVLNVIGRRLRRRYSVPASIIEIAVAFASDRSVRAKRRQ